MKYAPRIVSFLFVLLAIIPSLNLVFADQQSSQYDTKVWKTDVNKQIQLVADVENKQNSKQPFVYIVQVLDNDGKVILVNWITGTLQPHQTMSPAQSWTPTKPGTYTAQMFVWPCLVNCGALSLPLTMNISVT